MMPGRKHGLWFLLLLLPLAGCLDDGPSDGPADGSPEAMERQPHSEADRTDGPVETEKQNNRWKASREVLIENGIGDADAATVSQRSFNGVLAVAGSQDGGYALVATLYAYGDTEQQARDELERLEVVHQDTLLGGTLELTTTYEIDDIPALPLIGGTEYEGGMDLYLTLDDRPALDYDGATTNGAITGTAVAGPRFVAATTNGVISVSGAFDDVDLTTTNGVIGGELSRFSAGDGRLTAYTTNGAIGLSVAAGSEHGFDATGDTTNGVVALSLPDTETVGEQSGTHKHVRTEGYDSRTHRTVVELETTNGNIALTGS